MKRRHFLLAPAIIPGTALGLNGAVAPSNRTTVAIIGTGNQGFNDMKAYLRDERVQVTGVCDVNRESPGYWEGGIAGREPARSWVEWHYAREKRAGTYKGVTAFDDFRQVLVGAARKAGRDLELLEQRGAGPDHPVRLSCPETEYLKCVVARVL